MFKKDNTRQHTAHYLVSNFIHHGGSLQYSLKPADIAILFVVASYIDMNKVDHVCFAYQQKLANEIGLSRFRLNQHIAKLCSLNLLDTTKPGKSNKYKLGINIAEHVTFTCHETLREETERDTKRDMNVTRNVTSRDTKRDMKNNVSLYEYKNINIKDEYNNSPPTPSFNNSDLKNYCTAGEGDQVFLNPDGFLVECLSVVPKSNSKSYLPSSPRAFLNFTSENFNRIFEIWPAEATRTKAAEQWRKQNLEQESHKLVAYIEFRIANDHNWLRAIEEGNPHFIPRLENFLRDRGWEGKYIKRGDIENAKNRTINEKIERHNSTAAERSSASFEFIKKFRRDDTAV